MKFNKEKFFTVIKLIFMPLLPFIILIAPYSFLSQVVIVDFLSCHGANIVTKIFWFVVFLGDAVMTYFLAKKHLKYKKWFRIIYIIIALVVAYLLSRLFTTIMMYK